MENVYLMHKDIAVAKVNIDIWGFEVLQVLRPDHLPVGVDIHNINNSLDRWNKMRSIPQQRQGLDKIIAAAGNIDEAKLESMMVSLTDCYWIKTDPRLKWADVNYHDNGFAAPLAKTIFFGDTEVVSSVKTPDWTTDGILQKTWLSLDGKPTLVKFDSEKKIESANEVIAYKVAKEVGLSAAKYFPVHLNWNGYICGSYCFIENSEQEFVNAFQIAERYYEYQIELYERFRKMGLQREIDAMILYDFIIHNTDRHEKNFGILRDPSTLEVKGLAPLFDNGASFGSHISEYTIDTGETKPFMDSRMDQLGLISRMPFEVPDQEFMKNTIESVYGQFGVSESRLEIALNDLDKTYGMLQERTQVWSMNRDEIDLDIEKE